MRTLFAETSVREIPHHRREHFASVLSIPSLRDAALNLPCLLSVSSIHRATCSSPRCCEKECRSGNASLLSGNQISLAALRSLVTY